MINNLGMTDCKLYSVYHNRLYRCFNKNSHAYKDYGGRGIRVCDEWRGKDGYKIFRDWSISNGYREGLSIDRIDNDGNYEPNNCQWISKSENLAKANRINARRKPDNKLQYYGIDPVGQKCIFQNAAEFARQHPGLNAANIRDVTHKRKKTHKDWVFGFIEENAEQNV